MLRCWQCSISTTSGHSGAAAVHDSNQGPATESSTDTTITTTTTATTTITTKSTRSSNAPYGPCARAVGAVCIAVAALLRKLTCFGAFPSSSPSKNRDPAGPAAALPGQEQPEAANASSVTPTWRPCDVASGPELLLPISVPHHHCNTGAHICSEYPLTELLITDLEKQGARLLEKGCLVQPGWPQGGKGDLVFLLPNGSHLAVEVKGWCIVGVRGKTGCVRRTQHRRKVRQQACTYGQAWYDRQGGGVRVYAASYTTEWGLRLEWYFPASG